MKMEEEETVQVQKGESEQVEEICTEKEQSESIS